MSRCKLTNMNLRNTRKSRDYQCIMIDLVNAGVVTKSAAEELLGYTIPEGLLDGDTPGPGPDPEPEAETPVITTDLEATAEIPAEPGSIDLAVVAGVTDGGILSYAWTKDGDTIPDATGASLTVNEAGTYQCIITNTLGSDTATAQSTACVVTEEVIPDTVTLNVKVAQMMIGSGFEWDTEYGFGESDAALPVQVPKSLVDVINAAIVAEREKAPSNLWEQIPDTDGMLTNLFTVISNAVNTALDEIADTSSPIYDNEVIGIGVTDDDQSITGPAVSFTGTNCSATLQSEWSGDIGADVVILYCSDTADDKFAIADSISVVVDVHTKIGDRA